MNLEDSEGDTGESAVTSSLNMVECGALTDPKYVNFVEECEKHADKYFRDNADYLTTPLIECLSVIINTNDGKSSEVYGTIQVTDGEGVNFILYNRKQDDPETLSTGEPLTLTFPFSKGCAISPSGQVKVDIDINDNIRKAFIAKDVLTWDYSIRDDGYDEVQSQRVGGQCGYADIHYITYRHAVIATVEVLLRRYDDTSCIDTDVYGDIVARCGKSISSILFKKTQYQAVRVKAGGFIDLSRHVVAVPVHSTFEIEAELCIRDTRSQIRFKDTKFFDVDDHSYIPYTKHFGEGNGTIEVRVWWSNLHLQPPLKSKLKHKFEEASNGVNNDINQPEKKPRLLSDQVVPPSTLSVDRNFLSVRNLLSVIDEDSMLLEVFSVAISSNDKKDFGVWGTIKVHHWTAESFIFARDKVSAERVLSNQALPLAGPNDQCFTGYRFTINVKLKDVEDRVISSGIVVWDDRAYEGLPYRIGRRLCSVVPGNTKGEYAAIHYMLLTAGVQAKVKLWLVNKSSCMDCPSVCGSVYTRYGNHKYVTKYERDHYRSRLFHSAKPEVLSSDFHIQLSKSMVAVPLHSSLIVDLDLLVTFPQTQAPGNVKNIGDSDLVPVVETFRGELEFSIVDGRMVLCKTDREFSGSGKSIVVVSVEGIDKPDLASLDRWTAPVE